MDFIKPLFNLDFWINSRPGPFKPGVFLMLEIIFSALFFVGIILRLLFRIKKIKAPIRGMLRAFSRPAITMSLFGGLLLFFSYENAYLLSARFWYLLWLAVLIFWYALILRGLIKIVPKQIQKLKEEERKKKYFPPRVV